MAGRQSVPNYGPYYGGYGPPPFYQRFDTRSGVRFLFIAMIIFLISSVIEFLSFTLVMFSAPGFFSWVFFVSIILSSIAGFLALIAIIIGGVSLYLFHVGRFDFNARHTENIKWTGLLLVCYIIVLMMLYTIIFSFLFYLTSSTYYIYSAITKTINIILSFLLGFLILFLVKEIVAPRVRDMLYIFAGLMILVPIIETIFEIFLPVSFHYEIYQGTNLVIITRTFFALLHVIMWGLATFVFYKINNDIKTHGRTIPKEPPGFLPRPKPVAKYAGEFFSSPKRAIMGVVVVAIILGVAVGASYQVPTDPDSYRRDFPEDWDYGDVNSFEQSERGELSEGESTQMEVDLNCEVVGFGVYLTWTDEPDAPLRDNEPDRFTVEVFLDGLTESDSQANPHGDMGAIYFEWEFDAEEPLYVDRASITITLDYAGDQTGPGGIGRSPLTIEDNSNEYELEIFCTYL